MEQTIVVRPRCGENQYSIEIYHCTDELEVIFNGSCLVQGGLELWYAIRQNPNYEVVFDDCNMQPEIKERLCQV